MTGQRHHDGTFETGRVFSRAFEAIGANLPLFLGLALVLAGIPAFLMRWWQFGQIAPEGGSEAEYAMYMSFDFWGPFFAVTGVSLAMNSVLQASLTRATAMHLARQKPGFAQCLMIGLMLLLPLAALSFLIGFGISIGLALLIVPGVIVWIRWSVAIPAFVQERIGIFRAFGRSSELTMGNRGEVFGILGMLWIGMWAINACANWTLGPAIKDAPNPLPSALLAGILTALSSMVVGTVQTSVYIELRNVKEGDVPGELETIFS